MPNLPKNPAWVRAADAAAVAFAVLAVFVLLFGGFVLHLGPIRVGVHGSGRLLFLSLALVAIRHAARPADPLHRRIARMASSDADSPLTIARLALVSRIAALVAGYF